MKIAITGVSVTSGNRGVWALGQSLIELCQSNMKHSKIMFMIGNRKSEILKFKVKNRIVNVPIINCRLSPKAKIKEHLFWIMIACFMYRMFPSKRIRNFLQRKIPWIEILNNSDIFADIRGGDSFSDIYGFGRFIYGCFIAMTGILVKGSIVQFPQTIGPFHNKFSRWMAKYVLQNSSIIMVRDKISQKRVEDIIGKHGKIWFCPDVAFILEPVKPEKIEIYPQTNGEIRNLIGININGLMFNGGYNRKNMFNLKLDYKEFVLELIKSLAEVHKGQIWLIPHTYAPEGNIESDNEACNIVRESLPGIIKNRVRVVTGIYSCNELKWIIGQCEFFIGSRMHSCIAALSQGIACVGVAYSDKFKGIFDTVNMGDCVIDGRLFVNNDAIERIIQLYEERNEKKLILRNYAKKAREDVYNTFNRFFQIYHFQK